MSHPLGLDSIVGIVAPLVVGNILAWLVARSFPRREGW